MEEKGSDGPEVPSWLDAVFVARALQRANPTTVESSVELVSASLLGGGYLSHTFRVLARSRESGDSQPQETSLVVKIAPMTNGLLKDWMNDGAVFRKENAAYATFLPAVDAALRVALGNEWEPPWPRFYSEGSDPTSFLVIEDLEAVGFRKLPVRSNLDLDHCVTALQMLARIHAASVAFIDDPHYVEDIFREPLVFNLRLYDSYEEAIADGMDKMMKILDEYPWFRKYTEKLTKNARDIFRKTTEVVWNCEVDFKVMVHGDFHRNNLMFRRDSDDLKVRVYDFQGLHVGSPAEDLQYFLHTSASVDVLRDHTDHLVCEYHRTLQDTLRALGMRQQADGYPLEQLRRDMHHFRLVGVYVTFHILPLLIYDKVFDFSEEQSMDELREKSDVIREKYCRNERFLRYVEYLTPVFDSKGLLDCPSE